MLRFTDGEEFDLKSEIHLEERYDGWYVVGNNMLIPVRNKEEGKRVLEKNKKNNTFIKK